MTWAEYGRSLSVRTSIVRVLAIAAIAVGGSSPLCALNSDGPLLSQAPAEWHRSGPKNRVDLGRFMAGKCVAALPADGDHRQVVEWVSDVVDWWLQQDHAKAAEKLFASAESLSAAERDIPVVQAWRAVLEITMPGDHRHAALPKLWPAPKYHDAIPSALAWCVGVVVRESRLQGLKQTGATTETLARDLANALRNECATDRERWLVLLLPTRGWSIDLPYNARLDYPAIFAEVSPPIRDTLLGYTSVAAAWAHRGTKPPGLLTPKEAEDFKAALVPARAAFERAYASDNSEPWPAVGMLIVSKGEGRDFPECRRWLRRALAAQPDCHSAWTNYSDRLLPRWGGDLAMIAAVAAEIARCPAYDTDLPIVFAAVVNQLRDRSDHDCSLTEILNWPEVRTAWADYVRGIPEKPCATAEHTWRQTCAYALAASWTAGRYDDAQWLALRLGATDPSTETMDFSTYASSLDFIRTDLMFRSGPWASEVKPAESLEAHGRFLLAADLYAKLAARAERPDIRDWLAKKSASARLENDLAHGRFPEISASSLRNVIVLRQGALMDDAGAIKLAALPEQTAAVGMWIASRSTWRLELTIEVGAQTDATCGVFLGIPGTDFGIAIQPAVGSPGLAVLRANNLTNASVMAAKSYPNAVLRSFTLEWDGRELRASGRIGNANWTEPPMTPESLGGNWLLSITAAGQHAALAGAKIVTFDLQPLAPSIPSSETVSMAE